MLLLLGAIGAAALVGGRLSPIAAERGLVGSASSLKMETALPKLLVGIDLGTTNSAVAVLSAGEQMPAVIANQFGERLTPSTVCYTQSGVVVGSEAVRLAAESTANTVFAAKRFIGRKYSECGLMQMPFEVRADEDGDAVFYCPRAPEKQVRPEEVSAQVLLELLRNVEVLDGSAPISQAVITVPAYFKDRQRFATTIAGGLAGIERVTLLSEPVAAALAYGLNGAVGKVLVFDLGAGTFDVSALSLDGSGSIEVLASAGDASLGGNDFDEAIIKWLCKQARARGLAPRAERRSMRLLRDRAEAAKKRLSVVKLVQVLLPGTEGDRAGAPAVIEVKRASDTVEYADSYVLLSRDIVEEVCEPLLQRLKAPLYQLALSAGIALPGEFEPAKPIQKPTRKQRLLQHAAKPAGKQKYLPVGERVSEIVMVGGATHMVAVRKLVSNLFGVAPRRTVDPMEAVALGAAVYAGMRGGLLPGRVLQPWQAKLGRILEAARQAEATGQPIVLDGDDDDDDDDDDDGDGEIVDMYDQGALPEER